MIEFELNGTPVKVEVAPDTPLIWALREELQLTGTKYSCGEGICGACTVQVEGQATRACVTPVARVAGKAVTTIEGLAQAEPMHPVLKAWLDERVVQCGYCQAGQIMTAAAMLQAQPNPSDSEIDEVMSTVLCRCGTYPRIRKAVHRAAATAQSAEGSVS